MKTCLFVLLALFVALPVTRAADDARIQQLITQLGDEAYQKRQAATEELKSLGKAAEPQLKAVANHQDPEVRVRVAQLLQALEPQPTETGTGSNWLGKRRLVRAGAAPGVVQIRALAVGGNAATVQMSQESAFTADDKKYKVIRTENNGVKSLTVEITESKDGKEVTRTVEATDDDDLAKKDADLAKLVKKHAGTGQIIIRGGE